ncbi:nucleoside deaminase [Candidatus Leptofilum sp.]|uniref:nucleoside deaminase n=1 Tax=Candidatus Leptofilum sp. TaxID=3241576 RepID=UPI003B5C38A2
MSGFRTVKPMLWQSLSLPWQEAVSLAWEAYCAGSLPIGAVIVDDRNGRVVATGRNALFEAKSDSPLHGSRLAHAEMNALFALYKTDVPPNRCTLYTTLEPCPMCMGAIRTGRIGNVHFASYDPFAGCSLLIDTPPYQAFGPLLVHPPQNDNLAELLLVIKVEAMLRTGKGGWVTFVETAVPQSEPAINLGKKLFASGELWQLGRQGHSVKEIMIWLQDRLDI